MRHYCLGGRSAPLVCAPRSRSVRGARAGTWCCVSPVSPIPPRVSRAACGGLSRPGVPYPRPLVRHSTWSVRSASSVRLPFWYSRRALCVCVRSRSRGVRSPPPWVVWRAHLARSRHWALVGPFHVVCAPPRVLPRSLAPSGVLGGGQSGPGSPLPGLGLLLRGASEVRRSPSPDCPPTGRAVGVRYPRAVGAGGCGRGDPSATPQRALLRAVGAASGCPGGAPPAWVWGVRGRALSHPRLPALWAGCRGPLPTGCGCRGMRAWGPVTNPTARALACCGGGMRVPGGGASCLVAGRPGSGAYPPLTAGPLGGLPGPTTHWLWVRGAAGVGPRHQPHSARS